MGPAGEDDQPRDHSVGQCTDGCSGHDRNPRDWGPEDPGERPPIVAPESVFRGVPFKVSVTTLLPDGCWASGPHEVQSGSREATITVHDYWNGLDACILVASWSTREVDLVFTESGEAVIRLVGRRVSGDSATVPGEPMVVEHRVTVYEP